MIKLEFRNFQHLNHICIVTIFSYNMYLRVSVPSYRHTDKTSQTDQLTTNSDISVSGNGTLNLSDHIKNTSYGKGHIVYQIEVVSNNFEDPELSGNDTGDTGHVLLGQGRFFRLEKRYSAFLALHNELRKHYSTPEFPPKKLRNTSQKVLGIRRQQLEKYMQCVVKLTPVPKLLLDFLQVSEQYSSSHQLNNQNHGIVYSDDVLPSSTNEVCQHQPVLGFKNKEPFLFHTSEVQFQTPSIIQSQLPDIITQATLEYFYTR